jgi:hypothetical protein
MPFRKKLANKCKDCPYELVCSMRIIAEKKMPCYAPSKSWIFKFIKKSGKEAKVSGKIFK